MTAGARVGPNAITQMAAAIRAARGESAARQTFAAAGLAPWLDTPPAQMVDEGAAAALHRAVARGFAPATARALADTAGRLTADYLLAHRIPRPAQWVLRRLPAPLAARLLLRAIARNAWTFAGSGRFSARPGAPCVIEIAQNPLSTPGDPWHRAVIEHLFRALVTPRARARVTACCAEGARACRIEIDLRPQT